jgi:ferrous iron transport protein B
VSVGCIEPERAVDRQEVREEPSSPGRIHRIALVGAPNVGKSALFNRLTGGYVTVSNYPGTSVELTRGTRDLDGETIEVVDTPGMYSLLSTTEEERIARRLALEVGIDVIVHVIDAKNVGRMLPLTLQLLELGRPLVVALNMMDEADRVGVRLDIPALTLRLGVEVVPVVAVDGSGIEELWAAIARAPTRPIPHLPAYGNGVGTAIHSVRGRLTGSYPVDPTALAALMIQGDEEATEIIGRNETRGGAEVIKAARELAAGFGAPAAYRVSVERQNAANQLLDGVVRTNPPKEVEWLAWLGRALSRPAYGVPALLVVTYLGLYVFVGKFGAGVVVDWLEGTLFQAWINPFFERLFAGIPWESWRSLYVGEFGLLTLGLRYAVAIILPIVGTFFLFFSILEDSGYFPRLALLVDRVFKRLGLSGRAVIPIVLGFACDTMATMVTRTLETKRERVLATLLLALAIPCSAQLGVILALLSGHPVALTAWILTVLGSFLLVGAIGRQLLPGPAATFHMEIPPLRRPRLANVLTKTYTRMQWYFLEVLPLFLLASVLLWVGKLTGLFDLIVGALKPVVGALGLPAETGKIFLFGFFRRDYGAAGLLDLDRQGLLDPGQLAVAAVTLTLFVPCIAQFLIMAKERGVRTALAMLGFITPFAFGAGFLVSLVFRWLG